jgi:hypothetical protein
MVAAAKWVADEQREGPPRDGKEAEGTEKEGRKKTGRKGRTITSRPNGTNKSFQGSMRG